MKRKSKRNGSMMAKFTLIALILLSSVCLVNGQGYEQWSRNIGGSDTERFEAVQETPDGGFVAVGTIEAFGQEYNDLYMVKTDSAGSVEWEKHHGGEDDEAAFSVALTKDGGFIVVGDTKSSGAGVNDLWILKTDSAGEMDWEQIYGGAKADSANSILALDDGGYIIVGYTGSYGAGAYDVWLLKTDADGNILWNNTYGGSCWGDIIIWRGMERRLAGKIRL